MPPTILSAQLTRDGYDLEGASFPADRNTKQITFIGTGAAYFARFYKFNPDDPKSTPILDGVERLYPAGSGDNLAANIAGADFRSAVPGVPATIYGQQAFATDIISSAPAFGGGTQACCGGGMNLDTTDGIVDVNPTTQLFIGTGLTLTDGGGGQAHIALTGDPVYFDKHPQTATFLETTTTGAGPSGFGTLIQDTGGGVQIQQQGTDGSVTIHPSGELDLEGDTITMIAPAGKIIAGASSDDFEAHIYAAGKHFTFFDHLGAPIMQLTG